MKTKSFIVAFTLFANPAMGCVIFAPSITIPTLVIHAMLQHGNTGQTPGLGITVMDSGQDWAEVATTETKRVFGWMT